MAVYVCPDGTIAVNIAPTAAVGKDCARSSNDNEGLLLGPLLLLGKGMPEISVIAEGESLSIPN
jgi:hypothetical protein